MFHRENNIFQMLTKQILFMISGAQKQRNLPRGIWHPLSTPNLTCLKLIKPIDTWQPIKTVEKFYLRWTSELDVFI